MKSKASHNTNHSKSISASDKMGLAGLVRGQLLFEAVGVFFNKCWNLTQEGEIIFQAEHTVCLQQRYSTLPQTWNTTLYILYTPESRPDLEPTSKAECSSRELLCIQASAGMSATHIPVVHHLLARQLSTKIQL